MPTADDRDRQEDAPRPWVLKWGWCVCWAGLLACVVTPAFGQITYTVFPVIASPTSAPQAQPTDHHAVVVTLVVQDSTVAYVVNELSRQAHLQLAYDNGDARFGKRVSVRVTGLDVMNAFAMALKGTGLTARLAPDGETVLVRARSGTPQTRWGLVAGGIVTGRVMDSASGAGLGGASVKVAGAKLGTVTSDSGNFTLKDVPPGDQVLTVRLFGYKPVERTVTVVDSERTTVRIVMVSVPTVLSGVVTTATGQQRKIEVGNDITTLNVDSIRQVAPITSVTDLLDTRVPGLTVLHSSGTPGDPSRLRLRGAGSIQGNSDPIVIVDGIRVYANQSDSRNQNLAQAHGRDEIQGGISPQNISQGYSAPSPLDQIDPASIETIEVLKGPSATAIYGSDAASGVVVITTKHGRAGPTHWDLALADGVNWSPGTWPTNYYRFGYDGTQTANNGLFCQWYQLRCTVDSVVAFQALNVPSSSVFSHGSDQQVNVSVSGGTPTLTYSLTGSGSGDVGLLKLPSIEQQRYDSAYGPIPSYLVRPDNYTTWGVGGALTAVPTPAVRVTLQSSLFTSTQQQGSLSGAVSQLEGEYLSPSILAHLVAPLIQNDVERATSNSGTQTNIVSLHWQLRPWLPLDATGGINTIQRVDNTYIPFGVNNNGPGTTGDDTTGSYGLGRGASHDQTLTAGTAIPLHLVTLAIGGNLHSQSTSDVTVFTGQLAPGVSVPTSFLCPVPGNAFNNCPTTLSAASQSTYGWYVEPRLNIASKFFVSPGFRLDGGSGGSTSSGSVSGLSAFPKIDLSYVLVNRQNDRPLWGVVTLLRPRLAFGLAGVQPLPQYQLRLFDVGGQGITIQNTPIGLGTNTTPGNRCTPVITLDGTNSVPAVCLNSLGNTQLRPERTRELEGGVDANLWGNRLQVTYTQYDKTTQDAILDVPVAPSVASVGNQERNIGVIRNTGTELTVNAILLQSRAVSWNVGANLSNDNSLVVRLNPGQLPICYRLSNQDGPCSGTRIVAGYPLFGEWAQPIASFADVNHDGIIEANEYELADSAVYVGQPNPKYLFNLTTGITVFNGHLSVNATFAYVNGLTQDNLGACQSTGFELLPNTPNTPLATEAAVVAAGCVITQTLFNVSRTDIGLIQTVNTFRFQDLSINYTVPAAVSHWFRVPHMSLALQGSNLGLHTNYRGADPDVNAFSTVSAGDETADLGQLPEPRTWWLRLTMGN